MLGEIASLLGIAKSAIDIGKEAKDMLPDSKEKEHIEKQIALTEKELAIAEANAAKELNYDLCKCTFPPQIMLYKKDSGASECPSCGHTVNKKTTVAFSNSKYSDWI
jgi:hypothetical protein